MSGHISDNFNKYGKLSSNAEFLSQIAALYPKNPTKPREWSTEDIELLSSTMSVFGAHDEWLADDCPWSAADVTTIRTNIAIDHKLGVDYPQERRELLIAIQGDSLKDIFSRLIMNPKMTGEFNLEEENAEHFIETVFEKCNYAVNKEDLKRFFKCNF
jgi:hypothetical protein